MKGNVFEAKIGLLDYIILYKNKVFDIIITNRHYMSKAVACIRFRK